MNVAREETVKFSAGDAQGPFLPETLREPTADPYENVTSHGWLAKQASGTRGKIFHVIPKSVVQTEERKGEKERKGKL